MPGVILYGTGSAILVDYEESLHRIGSSIAVGIKNRPGESFLPAGIASIEPHQLDDRLRKLPFLVPLFTPDSRAVAAREAMKLGLLAHAPLVDPTSILPRRVALGAGTYINAGCCLGSASRFGAFVLINRGVTIGHDANFGDFVSTGPGAVVAGNVTIGDHAMLGAGCTVLPSITIGANATVGAGAVVTRDVPAHSLMLGNPARVVRDERDVKAAG